MSFTVLAELLQQKDAKDMAPRDLQILGNRAAIRWADGKHASLTDAVVDTVRDTALAPEQVQRVVEHANHAAFSDAFQKSGAVRTVEFHGGPADPQKVMLALSPTKTAADTSTDDYLYAPKSAHVAASGTRQALLKEAFVGGRTEVQDKVNDPLKVASDLQMDLTQQIVDLTSRISSMEIRLDTEKRAFHGHVREAVEQGATLSDVAHALSHSIQDAGFAKQALAQAASQLVSMGVLSQNKLASSFEARQLFGVRNDAHPVCVGYRHMEDTHHKIAAFTMVRDELYKYASLLRSVVANPEKLAESKGLIPGIIAAADKLSVPAGKAGGAVGQALFGPQGKEVGEVVASNAVKYSPHAAAVYGAHRASQTPVGRKLTNLIAGDDMQQPPPGYYY